MEKKFPLGFALILVLFVSVAVFLTANIVQAQYKTIADFVVQQDQSGLATVYMFGKDVFQIQTNPCSGPPSQNLDPQRQLGGQWDLYYFRLPEGDRVVLYFNGKPLREVPVVLADGSIFKCP